MNIQWDMEGWKLNGRWPQVCTAVHSHALRVVLGGRVADRPLRCYLTNTHNRKNGGNTYNATNCRISIAMKIFLLYFWYWKWLDYLLISTLIKRAVKLKMNLVKVAVPKPGQNFGFTLVTCSSRVSTGVLPNSTSITAVFRARNWSLVCEVCMGRLLPLRKDCLSINFFPSG